MQSVNMLQAKLLLSGVWWRLMIARSVKLSSPEMAAPPPVGSTDTVPSGSIGVKAQV